MDGVHDMGGVNGYGKVEPEDDYIFKADWQRRAFALVEALAWATPYNTDQHRHAVECLKPLDYLHLDYFEAWIAASETLLKDAGLIDQKELDLGRKLFDIDTNAHKPVKPDELVEATKTGADLEYPFNSQPASFKTGQTVRVSSNNPSGHTRVPRYVRGKLGKISRDAGVFQFADAVAAGKHPSPQHCYTVVFTGETLWGAEAEPNQTICLDLWEAYLEPV